MIVKFYINSYTSYFNGSCLPDKIQVISDSKIEKTTDHAKNIIDFTTRKYQKDYQLAKNWYVNNVSFKNPDISQAVEDNAGASELIKALSIWSSCKKESRDIQDHPILEKHNVLTNIGFGRALASGGNIGANSDCIILPMRDKSGPLSGIYCIDACGNTEIIGNYGAFYLFNQEDIKAPIYIVSDWLSVSKNIHMIRHESFCITFNKQFNLFWAMAIDEAFESRDVVILEEG